MVDDYSILIQYDPSDDIYVAGIPELKGYMAHGKTKEQAIHEICIARDLWLETAREVGKKIPKPIFGCSITGNRLLSR